MLLRVPVDGKKRFFRGYFVFFSAVILAVIVAVTAGQLAFYGLIKNDGRLIFGKYAAVAEILTDEAEVYSPDTSNDKSTAFYSPLPKGTLDYIAGRESRIPISVTGSLPAEKEWSPSKTRRAIAVNI